MRSVERRLERLVDGAVGRFFRGGVRPVEIGHRLVREMADSRSVGVKGQSVVANHFEVRLNETDLARFADVEESLARELCEAAREAARDDGWNFMGPVQVVLTESADVRPGQLRVDARMKEADGATGVLHLSNGQQVVLGEYRLTFGRLPECTITFDDTNVSREHAEICPDGDGFVLTDPVLHYVSKKGTRRHKNGGTDKGAQGVLIYIAIYVAMTLGSFSIILAMKRNGQAVEKISDFAGLSRTNPLLAFIFAMLLFSLAGVPPLAGFYAAPGLGAAPGSGAAPMSGSGAATMAARGFLRAGSGWLTA